MLCLFLFHIDYTFCANNVFIKQQSVTRDIELFIQYLTIFSLRTFTRKVKVVQSYN